MRVLIVDDHGMLRRGVAAVLTEGLPGVVVCEAATADEARALAAGCDLVLLDITLGASSGIDLLTTLREAHPRLPVLMLSAHPEAEFAVRCLKLGAAGYVGKSASSDELLVAARKVLAGGRYITASLGERLAGVVGRDHVGAPHDALSSRELQVLRAVATGHSLKEIAAQLALSEKTIATYRARLSSKLGLSTNVELTRYALANKLVE